MSNIETEIFALLILKRKQCREEIGYAAGCMKPDIAGSCLHIRRAKSKIMHQAKTAGDIWWR